MRYLLDTNAVIALINGTRSPVARRARRQPPNAIGLPAVVIHELYYGAYKSQRTSANLELVERLRFEVLPFTREDARRAGEVRALLAKAGTPIGPYDALIAGQALERRLTLITANTTEFSRVSGLRLVDWSR